MTRVPVHDLESAPPDGRQALEPQSERVGQVINIFGAMAHAPTLINLYDRVETLLGEQSSLDPQTREAIHLTVAAVNDCEYCQAAYTGSAKVAGFSDEETIQIRGGALDGDEKLSALLALAREIAAHTGHVEDRTWKTALTSGWTDAQLLEAYADVVRTILTNYFNHLVGTELDLPPAPQR
jgi:AhpD family alkylhydroperoxidase